VNVRRTFGHRVSTGNQEADTILGGGFLANSINVIMGEPGTGKTLLVRAARGERPRARDGYTTLNRVASWRVRSTSARGGRWAASAQRGGESLRKPIDKSD
jgi:hypothetical protein